MYEKNLKNDFRLRLSDNDMQFIKDLAEKRGCTVSEAVRSILGEYRRNYEMLQVLSKALDSYNE